MLIESIILRSDDSEERNKLFSANETGIVIHVYFKTFPRIIDVLISRFLTNVVLYEALDLVTRAPQWPNKNKLEFKIQVSTLQDSFVI